MSTSTPQSLRDNYKQQTRKRILDAALDIMREAGEDAVTMSRVAVRAGVTDRTVYRHFETRDILLQAAWERVQSSRLPHTPDELIETPREIFWRYDNARELARASVYSRVALEARLRSNEERQRAMLECIRDELYDLDERSLRRRAAIVQLLTSPYAWEVMTQFWGFDGAEAGEAAAEALEVLLGRRLAD